MNDDTFMRRVLLLSAGFNLLAGLLFAFPNFPTGRLAGLPSDVSGLCRATVFLFVVLFGAIGKASFFALVLLFWSAGALPGRSVWAGSGDAVLAGVFALWLYTGRHDVTVADTAARGRTS
jgi:hypothetical protein